MDIMSYNYNNKKNRLPLASSLLEEFRASIIFTEYINPFHTIRNQQPPKNEHLHYTTIISRW